MLAQRRFGNPMPRLDDRRLAGARGGADARRLGKKFADRHRVGGVVGALVDYLEHVVGAQDRGRDLNAAGAPAVRHRHLTAGKRDLVAGNRDRLEDGAADHALGLLVEIGEVVDWRAHSAASRNASAPSRNANSARIRRTSPSSAWKST